MTLRLIREEDFRSVELEIKLRNLTTETLVEGNKKTIGNAPMGGHSNSNAIQLLEIFEDALALSVPRFTCAMGHSLEIEISALGGVKPVSVKFIGDVKELDRASTKQDRIVIDGTNAPLVAWERLCGIFGKRQKEIEEFFKAVKGY